MAFKATYMLREAGSNLIRNWTHTIAATLTVAVSLTLFGSFLLVGYAVDNATQRWEGGIEFVVWMNPDATPEQDAAIRSAIDSSPEIETFTYVDQQAAYAEFQDFFSDQPELLETVRPEDLPPSYRVVPVDPDPEAIDALASTFEGQPGVRTVIPSNEAVKEMQRFTDRLRTMMFIFSVVLVGVALILMSITITVAISARRREVEVMKLVGATNWFIRVPFMLEGLAHGLLGAGLSILGVRVVDKYVIDSLNTASALKLLDGFDVSSSEFQFTAIILVLGGAAVAFLGAGFAVSRHLDV